MYKPTNLKLWTRPDSYIGASYPDTYRAGFGQSRDSDCLERSNFRVAVRALEAVSDRVRVIHEGHFLVGWVEWVAIPADDVAALQVAEEMVEACERYPILDEDDHSALEQEEADQVWKECYSASARAAYIRKHRNQFEFRDLADMLGCVRGKYFAGWASELVYR